jgi:hypothetical protein
MGDVFLFLLCLCGSGVVLFLILNRLYQKTNACKNTLINIQKYIDGVPENLSVVNLGSTFAWYNFDYADFPVKGFNFALIPQPLSYDFKILQQYHEHINKNGVVLITLVLFSFYVDFYRDDNANTKYYYFLKREYINTYNVFKHWINKNFPLLRNPRAVKRIIKDVPSLLTDNDALNTESNIAVAAKNRVNGWQKQFGFRDMDVYRDDEKLNKIVERTIDTLKKIIHYCIENSFKPVIVVTPVYKKYFGLVSDDMIKKCLYDNIERANTQNIPVLNYLNDKRFQDYALYINSDCLNRKGRELFSNILYKDLIAWDLL